MTMSLTTNCVFAQVKKTPAKKTTTRVAKPAAETGPTKEETIAWLKEKLVKYFDYFSIPVNEDWCSYSDENNSAKDILIQLNECELTIATIHKIDRQTESDCPSKSFIPTTNIIIGDHGTISCKIQGIHTIDMFNRETESRRRDITFSKKGAGYSNKIGSITNGEVDLYKKMQKAFDHLATFCPKKKELF
jgi:hypothetical protein